MGSMRFTTAVVVEDEAAHRARAEEDLGAGEARAAISVDVDGADEVEETLGEALGEASVADLEVVRRSKYASFPV
jgi:hypothetical protein